MLVLGPLGGFGSGLIGSNYASVATEMETDGCFKWSGVVAKGEIILGIDQILA
jgi:hypothetical protein